MNLLVAAAQLFVSLLDALGDFAKFLVSVTRGRHGSGTGTIRRILRLPLVAQDGYPRRIAQLRGKWEPATFSGSHGCLLCRRLWLGARWCYRTSASRLLTSFSSGLSSCTGSFCR